MKKEYNPFNKICKYLIFAFVASSGGKFNYEPPLEGGVCSNHIRTWQQGYSVKELYILKAIKELNKNKYLGIRYYVSFNKEDRAPYLISFLIKNKDGKDIYISYHSYSKKSFAPLVGQGGKPIRYRHQKGADAAKELQALIEG